MNQSVRDAALLLCVAGIVFLSNLGGPRLWDRDEPRNAGCAAEMLAANDWVTPVFNGQLREHKPVLTYWFMMLSYSVFGVTEFAARLPSALLGAGTCLLTYFIGRRLFGRSAGVWSAIILATTLMFGVASRAATPDAPLIFCSTLALAIYVAGVTSSSQPGMVRDFPSWPVAAAMYAAMGMAVLAKGPIGFVLPTAVIGMSLLIRRLPESKREAKGWLSRLITIVRPFAPLHFLKTCWVMRPITAIAAVLIVAAPWYIWVHLRTEGAWTYGFFMKHNVGRAMNSMDGHSGGPLFYPVALLVGFFPWSIFWLSALREGLKQRRDPSTFSGALFALCWVGVYVGLFSFARTKLPSYITPCYPGLALLTGLFVDRWTQRLTLFEPIWRRLAFGSLITVGVVLGVALPILSRMFLPGEEMLGAIGAIPLIGGIGALLFAEQNRALMSVRITAVTAVAFTATLFAVVAMRIDRHRHLEDLVAAVYGDESPADVEVASLSSTEASWVFYCRQPIREFGEAKEAFSFLSSSSPEGKRRALITTRSHLKKFAPQVRLEEYTVSSIPYFMEDDQIVVLEAEDVLRSAKAPHKSAVQ